MSPRAPRLGFILAVPLLSTTLFLGCQSGQKTGDDAAVATEPVALDSPAGAGSRYPNLSVDAENRVYMTWFEERGEDVQALLWSRLDGDRWSAPRVIAEGDSFFVNWADFPSLLPLDGDRLVAHWPWKSGGDTYAYDVRMAFSTDDGESWIGPFIPHDDGTPTEHGFVSLLAEGEGVRAVWLDGRNFAGHGGHGEHDGAEDAGPSMTLRTALISADGSVIGGEIIDERTCDCCPTSMVATPGGVIVAYRDRSETEVRDISVLRYDGSAWSDPVTLHTDGWKIAGCPVNGPALAANGDDVVAAWYSEAGDEAKVMAVISDDGGRTFGEPMEMDGGDPIGRVDAVYLEDGSALVTWLEGGEETAMIRLRRIRPDGTLSRPVTIAEASAARAGGFPRMVRAGERLIFAWTELGEPPRIRLAESRIAG
jgi:hypothetical protein